MKNISCNEALKELGWTKHPPTNALNQYAYDIRDETGKELGTFNAHQLTAYLNERGLCQPEPAKR